MSRIAIPMSVHNFNFSWVDRELPRPAFTKSNRSPCIDISNIKTGQTWSPSPGISQHIPSSVTTNGWSRIAWWLSIIISLMTAWKGVSSSIKSSLKRLKAKLVCTLADAWLILAWPPCPKLFSRACHVMGSKEISNRWARAKRAMKLWSAYWVAEWSLEPNPSSLVLYRERDIVKVWPVWVKSKCGFFDLREIIQFGVLVTLIEGKIVAFSQHSPPPVRKLPL